MNQLSATLVLEKFEASALSFALSFREDELTRRIDTLTQHQIRDLRVQHDPHKVVLNGCSKSYYVKQLASQAVIDLLPGVVVENSIDVLC